MKTKWKNSHGHSPGPGGWWEDNSKIKNEICIYCRKRWVSIAFLLFLLIFSKIKKHKIFEAVDSMVLRRRLSTSGRQSFFFDLYAIICKETNVSSQCPFLLSLSLSRSLLLAASSWQERLREKEKKPLKTQTLLVLLYCIRIHWVYRIS